MAGGLICKINELMHAQQKSFTFCRTENDTGSIGLRKITENNNCELATQAELKARLKKKEKWMVGANNKERNFDIFFYSIVYYVCFHIK